MGNPYDFRPPPGFDGLEPPGPPRRREPEERKVHDRKSLLSCMGIGLIATGGLMVLSVPFLMGFCQGCNEILADLEEREPATAAGPRTGIDEDAAGDPAAAEAAPVPVEPESAPRNASVDPDGGDPDPEPDPGDATSGGGGEPVTGEGLDPEQVRSVVLRHLADVEACYSEEIQDDPDPTGKIVVEMTIGEDGSALEVAIASDSLGDNETAACIVEVFSGMSFPESGGTTSVRYPIVFSPSG